MKNGLFWIALLLLLISNATVPNSAVEAQTLDLAPSADTYLKSGTPNKNQGTETILRVQDSGNNRVLIQFDSTAIQQAVGSGTFVEAKLRFYISSNGNNWGTDGGVINVHRILQAWTHLGATWSCPIDSNPGNSGADCSVQWNGGEFFAQTTDDILVTNGSAGWIEFDVTSDISAFLAQQIPMHGWMIRKEDEGSSGKLDFNSSEVVATAPKLSLLVESATNDPVAPRVTITQPSLPYIVGSPTPQIAFSYFDGGTGINPAGIQVHIDSTNITANCVKGALSTTCNPPAQQAGLHVIHVQVPDQAGNVGTASYSFELYLGDGPHVATFAPVADSFLRKGSPNQNQGSSTFMRVRSSGQNRSLIRFDQSAIAQTIGSGTLQKAILELYVQKNGENWGATGRTVDAHRLLEMWNEQTATWNCSNDSILTNTKPDCAIRWNGGNYHPSATSSFVHTKGMQGWIQFDVTQDMAAFLAGTTHHGWLIRKTEEGPAGFVEYTSKEATTAHIPRLILIFNSGEQTDATDPTITATITPQPNAAGWNNSSVTVSFTCADEQSNIESCSPPVTISTEGAGQPVIGHATDSAGNEASIQIILNIDKTPPAITIHGVEQNRFYSQPPTAMIQIHESNPGSTMSLLDGLSYVSGSPVAQEGRHNLHVTAVDLAGNSAFELVSFGVDVTPPTIVIQTPQDDTLFNFDSIQVSGTLQEQFIKEVTVNGTKAIASSDLFVANHVHLNDGSNTITVVATDLAGSSSQKTVTVRLDQTPPSVLITSPANGVQLTMSLIHVNGTIGGGDVHSVAVNGIPAVISGMNFSVGNLRLSEGVNTIRAIARDSAGNTRETSVQVTLDTQGPRIAVTSPIDGSFTTANSITVEGFIFDSTATTLTINDTAVNVQSDGSFSTTVNLTEGTNLITLFAKDGLGNQVTSQVHVLKDSQSPALLSISPGDASIGVPADQLIEIRFSEEIKKSTISSNTIKLMAGTNIVASVLQTFSDRVIITPHQPLAGATTFTVSVLTGITDLVGNSLQSPASASFTTLDNLAPAPATIEPELPQITSETTILVAGTAEANSTIEITGGAVRINTVASATGHYSAEVALFPDAVNQLTVTVTDISGNTSTPTTATVIQDSLRMVVVDASYEIDGSIIIDFSKSVLLASITPQNIFAVATGTIAGSVISGADPARVIFYPQTPLGNAPFVLRVEGSVQDQGGHALEYPFSKLFNGASGDSFVQGEVWDNASGQPLAGATVTQIAPLITPPPVATTDLKGQFVLPVSSGALLLRLQRPGYLSSYRSANVLAGSAQTLFDIRLEPVDSTVLTLTSSQATLTNSAGSVSLLVPSGSVSQNSTAVLSRRDGQSLPGLLPPGWAPVAVGTIQTAVPFQVEITLRVKNESGMGAFSSTPTAYYDEAAALWRSGPSGFVSSDGQYFEVQTNKATTHAFLLFDPTNPPPPSLPDQPLQQSVAGAQVALGMPNLVAIPVGIYPQQRAVVSTTFSGAEFRSGSQFQAILRENFTLLAGLGSVQTTPKTADLIGYSMGQPSKGEIKFFASPSKAIDFTQLDVGFIDVEIHAFPHSTEQPGVIGSAGGMVSSADGNVKLEIPAGALSRSVPVTVIALRTQDVTLVIPDYTLVSAFEVNLAGTTLSLPGIIDSHVSSAPSGQLIVARLAQIGSRSLWVIEATATYDGARIRSVAGPGTLRGIVTSGVYGIFAANIPIGFITGSITGPQSGASGPHVLVTSDQNPLVALSDLQSTYTLAIPAGSGIATASNRVSGDQGSSPYSVGSEVVTLHLQIVTTPPRILAIVPPDGITNAATNSVVRVTFSEAILASSLTSSTIYLLSNSTSVGGRLLLTSNNTIGIFTPSNPLVSDTRYTVVVTNGIKDLAGNPLANPTATHLFRTADTTPPQPASTARFKLFLPENGNVRFEVPEEDIEPGTALIFFNDTKRTSISANNQNGFYTASIAGNISDIYFILLSDPAGNETRVEFARMEYADGSGAVFPTTGGAYTTGEGIIIEISDGTFDAATPVQLHLTTPDPQTVTPTPRDFTSIGYFTLNLNGATAKKPIELSFPVPQGVSITADSQIFAAKPVEFFGKRKWMPVEPLKLEEGMLKTQSPPWPGIVQSSLYIVAASQKLLYFLHGTLVSLPAVIEFSNSDFVLMPDTHAFVGPLPIGEAYELTVTDLNTGGILFEGQPAPPSTEAQTTIHLQNALSNDKVPPYLIGASPLTVTSWRVGTATGTILTNITFQASDQTGDGIADTTGLIAVTGDQNSLPEYSYVAVHNSATGETGTSVASSAGMFDASVAYTFGDPITLLLSSVDVDPGATLRFNFSEPIQQANFGTLLQIHETLAPTQTIQFSSTQLQAQQILEIRPLTNLKSETDYTVILEGLQDIAGNTIKKFEVQFRTRTYGTRGGASSGIVNDSLLIRNHLLVGKDDGIEIFSTANPFDLELISTLPIPGGVRSFAPYGEKVVVVGGGVSPHGGLLRVLTLTDFSDPQIERSFTLSRFVGDTSDDAVGVFDPIEEGRPIKVLVSGNRAYVANIGIGVQVINLDQLGSPITSVLHHRKYSEPNLKDLALYVKNDDPSTTDLNESVRDIVLSGSSMISDADSVPVSFKAIDVDKVLTQVCAQGPGTLAEARCQDSSVRSSTIPGTANNVEVMMHYEIDIDQDGRTGLQEDNDHLPTEIIPDPVDDGIVSQRDAAHTNPRRYEIHDLAFISGSTNGIHVLDVTDINDPTLLGTIKVGDGISVADLKLDSKNLRLYVPVGGDGIYIVDIKDPFLIDPNGAPQVIGKIQFKSSPDCDPSTPGCLINTDGNITIDEELNTVHVATRDGLKSVLVGNLPLEVVRIDDHGTPGDRTDDSYHPVGIIESEGYIKKHDSNPQQIIPWEPGTTINEMRDDTPTMYAVRAYLPTGAAGESGDVKIKVSSTTFFDQPLKTGAGFPASEIEVDLKYQAPSNPNTEDESFRLFISEPFYVTAHPLLPDPQDMYPESEVLSAGDFVKVEIDAAVQNGLEFITTDLLRQSRAYKRSLRMDWMDSEKPEPAQEPATGNGETSYPPYLHSGEWMLSAADFGVKGRDIDFGFVRKYESQALYDGPLGFGWDHSYFARLLELPNGDVFFFNGMGRKDRFTFTQGQGYSSPLGVFLQLQKLKDGNFLITDGGGSNLFFNNYGQLASITDRNGNQLEFIYNPAGQLSIVLDTMGRPIHYEYDSEGKLAKVTDFDNRQWKFYYDEDVAAIDGKQPHLLTSVETPKPSNSEEPRVTTYSYSTPTGDRTQLAGVNLQKLKDARGRQFLENEYDSADRLKTQQFGKVTEKLTFTYDDSVHKTEVTDRRGKKTTYQFDYGVSPITNNSLSIYTDAADFVHKREITPDGLTKTVQLPGQDQWQYEYVNDQDDSRAKGYIQKETLNAKAEDAQEGDPVETISREFKYFGPFHLPDEVTDFEGNKTDVTAFDHERNPATIQMPENVTQHYQYDDFGQVTKSVDGQGHHILYEYYPEQTSQTVRIGANTETGGYLKRTVDMEARVTEYVYDARGNVIEMRDPNGVVTKNIYNNLDQLVETIQADSTSAQQRTLTKYDENGNVVETLAERESGRFAKSTFEYGILNNLEKKTDFVNDVEVVTEFQYDENYNQTATIFPEGNRVEAIYDNRNLKSVEIRGFGSPEQATNSFVYDKNGQLKAVIDGRGNITEHQLDPKGRPIVITYPEGNQDMKIYDNNDLLLEETTYRIDQLNPDGSQILLRKNTFEYDGLQRLKRETIQINDPDPGATYDFVDTSYEYDLDNLVTGVTDALGRKTTTVYDFAHRKKQVSDLAGNSVEYQYDGNNNITAIKETAAAGANSHLTNTTYTTTNEYDARNRLIKTTDTQGHSSHVTFDLAGNVTSQTDPLGNTTSFKYDDLHRQVEKRISSGSGADVTTRTLYDKNSRRAEFVDARSNITRYHYDPLNRLSAVDYPAGQTERTGYDGNDNIIRTLDRNGTETFLTYDKNNRLIERSILRAGAVRGVGRETFSYDDLGRMTVAADEDSRVEMTYDSRGLIWREQQLRGSIVRHYDQVGNNKRIIYPFSSFQVQLAHDNVNRLTAITDGSQTYNTLAYLGTRASDRVAGNGLATAMTYDTDGRLTELFHGTNANVAGFQYQWDDAHFKTQETLKHWWDAKNTYGYDGAHRISTAQIHRLPAQSFFTNYGYDGADNITSKQTGNLAQAFGFGPENRQLSDSDNSFVYDNNGNLTTHRKGNKERRYFYDYADRLVEAQVYENGQLVHTMTAEYDPLGRRTARIIDGNRTEYVYDGQQVVQELNGAGNVVREYIWGNSIDQLVAIRQSGNTYYAHQDSIGSMVAITNQNGALVERYTYDEFGQPYVVREIAPPCVSTVTKQSNVVNVDFCGTISSLVAEASDISLTTIGNQPVPFSFTTSGDVLNITITEPLPSQDMRLVVFGVEGDGTVIGERIERTFATTTEGQLDSGGANVPISVIVDNSSIGNKYLFQGREWEPELGLYYYRARYYDPSIGRFLQHDPYVYSDSPNLYQAFLNNPANYTDPMGTRAPTPEDRKRMKSLFQGVRDYEAQWRSNGSVPYNYYEYLGDGQYDLRRTTITDQPAFDAAHNELNQSALSFMGAVIEADADSQIQFNPVTNRYHVWTAEEQRDLESALKTTGIIFAVTRDLPLAASPYAIRAQGTEVRIARGAKKNLNLLGEGQGTTPSMFPESYLNRNYTVDMRNAPLGSATNAANFPRNGPWFWRQMLRANPELFDAANAANIRAGRAPVINEQWLKYNPQHKGFLGKILIHHHIDQGAIATPLPERIHLYWDSTLHPK